MNVKESKERMLHYLREAYINNRAIAPELNLDYTASHLLFANAEQRYLATAYDRLTATVAITRSPIVYIGGFGTVVYGDIQKELLTENATAYSFEADDASLITLMGQTYDMEWTVIQSGFQSDTIGLSLYKGLINTNIYKASKLVFQNGRKYHVRNAVLFVEQVNEPPAFSPYVALPIPLDFFMLKAMRMDGQFYLNYLDDRGIKVPYLAFGTFEMTYYRYPKEVNEDTDLFEISPVFADLIPLKCAAMVALEEKMAVANFLEEQYRVRLSGAVNIERKLTKRVKNSLWR